MWYYIHRGFIKCVYIIKCMCVVIIPSHIPVWMHLPIEFVFSIWLSRIIHNISLDETYDILNAERNKYRYISWIEMYYEHQFNLVCYHFPPSHSVRFRSSEHDKNMLFRWFFPISGVHIAKRFITLSLSGLNKRISFWCTRFSLTPWIKKKL